jgi:integrase
MRTRRGSVSKRLGHAKPSTTLTIYAHAFKKRDQESAQFMDGLYIKKEDKDRKINQ